MRSLYLHIPFCRWVCHYCDFAKSANHDSDLRNSYLKWLEAEVHSYLSRYKPTLSTVFFGGGTPSIFTHDYQGLFDVMAPFLSEDAEISIEANPEDVNLESIREWRRLGFNRISLGVQSFDPLGLKFFTRSHSPTLAAATLDLCLEEFPSVNADLIYGWPGQSQSSWENDLELICKLGIQHASLYCLTFESQTVIGRRYNRGLIESPSNDELWLRYQEARRHLAAQGFNQEEVSNWSLPNHSCRHNWTYWTDQHFIGVGTGAHGYLPGEDGNLIGHRYAYPKSHNPDKARIKPVTEVRTKEQWLYEYIGSALRTCQGIDLNHIKSVVGKTLRPNNMISRGIDEDLILVDKQKMLLNPDEWFRESAWAVEVINSLSE